MDKIEAGEREAFPRIKILYAGTSEIDQWNYLSLSDPFWRLYWNDRPGAELEYQGKSEELLPDRLIIMPSYTCARSTLKNPVKHFACHFLLPYPWSEFPPGIFTVPAVDIPGSPPDTFLPGLPNSGVNQGKEIPLKIMNILYYALSTLPFDQAADDSPDPRIRKVLDLIHYRIHRFPINKNLSNKTLAEAAGLHCNAFTRLFKKELGISPQKYITTCRIERSCLLLQECDRTIDQVALDTGFIDRYHFTRVFTRQKNISPGRYRKLTKM